MKFISNSRSGRLGNDETDLISVRFTLTIMIIAHTERICTKEVKPRMKIGRFTNLSIWNTIVSSQFEERIKRDAKKK